MTKKSSPGEKIAIKNRRGQKIVVLVEKIKNPKGLAFVMHGLSGFKEQPHIVTFAQAFKEKGLTTVRFDTTNTFGESEGNYEDATTTNYYEDLEDVINWSRTQSWYQEPFYLVGHSLGSLCCLLYAEKFPGKIKGLAPISTVVSGKLSAKAHGKKYLDDWKRTGWHEEESVSIPGLIKRLKWSHMIDRLKHDTLPKAAKLVMPVLLIVGEKDRGTPLTHQKILYSRLPGKKELHVIKGAPHTFKEPRHLAEILKIFKEWLGKVESKPRIKQ